MYEGVFMQVYLLTSETSKFLLTPISHNEFKTSEVELAELTFYLLEYDM